MAEYIYNPELTRKNINMLWNTFCPIPLEFYTGQKTYTNQSIIILVKYDSETEEYGEERQFIFWPDSDDNDWFIPFDLEEIMGKPVQWLVEEVVRHGTVQLLFDDKGGVSFGWWEDEALEE